MPADFPGTAVVYHALCCQIARLRFDVLLNFRQGTMVTIYGIKSCDAMKKVRSWLEAQKITHDFHNYKTAGIDKAMLEG
jgi:hypothetical protein